MASPLLHFFHQYPSSVVLQTTDNFDGTAHTMTPIIQPGIVVFPDQCCGGLYNFHTDPLVYQQDTIEIKEITWQGAGTCEVYRVTHAKEILIHTFSAEGDLFDNITLSPTEYLKFVSTGTAGTKTIVVTASLAAPYGGV